jgi:HD superfamily phosphohydrolase
MTKQNKNKIINDPVYGFIKIPYDLVFELMEHPWFQRLRRIKQLGLTHLVYPGALHTRFHHALGAMWLTTQAIDNLKLKGVKISDKEAEATCVAVLLHDIGHGPFSHALENSIVQNVQHETISTVIMQQLNKEFKGKLTLAIDIFNDVYGKKFLHQLVSGQLDMDRLDYLRRDCFFTGVLEGMIGSDRIIKMLDVRDDELVVEVKGIYSIENFIISRRLMYWQVYLHKTVLAAEQILIAVLKRAKQLAQQNVELFATPALKHFLYSKISAKQFMEDPQHILQFSQLDDNDITASIKVWQQHADIVLSTLCRNILDRKLPEVIITDKPTSPIEIEKKQNHLAQLLKISFDDAAYFVLEGKVENNAYNSVVNAIKILYQDGVVRNIAEASDTHNIMALSKTVKKYYLTWYNEIEN